MQEDGQQHQIPPEDVHLEALEDPAEQSENPDETGRTTLGGFQRSVLR